MADSFIIIDEPAVTDKKLDTEQITVGANTVERERFIISGQGATDFSLPVAHDAVDAGNPLKVGGRASSSAPADVSASGDRVNAYFDMKGRLAVFTDVPLPAGTNNIGDVDVLTLPAIPAGGNKIGSVDLDSDATPGSAVPATAQYVAGTDGTNARGLKTDAAGELQVDVLSVPAPLDVVGGGTEAAALRVTLANDSTGVVSVDDNGSSLTVDGTVTANQGGAPWSEQGNVAHDSADSGNPLKIGGRADTTFQTAVADGDRVDAVFDVYGVQAVRDDHPNKWSYHDDDVVAVTTDGTVQSAPGVGLSVYITDIIFSVGAATASSIFLEESTTKILGPYYLEAIAGRSIHIRFKTPKKATANTAVLVTNTGAISFSVDILGFIAP